MIEKISQRAPREPLKVYEMVRRQERTNDTRPPVRHPKLLAMARGLGCPGVCLRIGELHCKLRIGRQRLKLTASSTTQCRSKSVSAKSLPKTGISGNLAGDFRQILAKVVAVRSLETKREARQSPYFAGFSRSGCNLS